jgi:hypothetical protein
MGLMDDLNAKKDQAEDMREKTDLDDRALAELKKHKKAGQEESNDID